MKTGKYTAEALLAQQIQRQAVLDWLHQHPASSLDDIADAMPEISIQQLTGVVISMAKRGEIVSVSTQKCRVFTAIERTTASAEKVLAARKAKQISSYCRRTGKSPDQIAHHGKSPEAIAIRRAARDSKLAKQREEAERAKESESRPGHYIHKPGSMGPIHGGQGAVRARTSINCGQVW